MDYGDKLPPSPQYIFTPPRRYIFTPPLTRGFATSSNHSSSTCCRYARQHLLVIDEVGYLSYSNRHADLLFNIVSSRSQQNSTIITTNRPFAEWGEAFPNAACLVALVDRLVHNAEIIAIDVESWRHKEAEERQKQRSAERRRRRAGKAGARDRGEPPPA